MKKVWTINQINEAWKEYAGKKVIKVLRNGKWEIEPVKGGLPSNIRGVRAEVVFLKSIVSFPQYLQDNYA